MPINTAVIALVSEPRCQRSPTIAARGSSALRRPVTPIATSSWPRHTAAPSAGTCWEMRIGSSIGARSSTAASSLPRHAAATNTTIRYGLATEVVLAQQCQQVRPIHAREPRGLGGVTARAVDQRAQVVDLEAMERGGAGVAIRRDGIGGAGERL